MTAEVSWPRTASTVLPNYYCHGNSMRVWTNVLTTSNNLVSTGKWVIYKSDKCKAVCELLTFILFSISVIASLCLLIFWECDSITVTLSKIRNNKVTLFFRTGATFTHCITKRFVPLGSPWNVWLECNHFPLNIMWLFKTLQISTVLLLME